MLQHARVRLVTAAANPIAMLEQVDAIGERLRRQMEDMVRESLDTVTERLRAELELLVRDAVDKVLSDDDPQTLVDPDVGQPAGGGLLVN